MSIRSTATRLGALVGAAALLGGIALTAGSTVFAQAGQATPTATATAAGPTPAVNLGGPAAVPAARFSGTVNAPNGATVVASIGGVACGFGTVTNGSYYVDIQEITGCSTAGASVNFTVDGDPASPTGTVPALEGTAVILNLTKAAATAAPTTAPTPPPPPTVTKTTAPTPPPPPKTAAPTTAPTKAPTAAPTKTAQAPSAQKPAGAQAPAGKPAAQQAPAGVRLPNTGTGGVSDSGLGFGLLGILLGAFTLSITGIAAYRRSR